jgi:hypothetical protein
VACLDAYTKLVNDVKNAPPDAKADNVQQAVKMSKPGKLYAESNLKSAVVRDLDPGMMLYPTGDKMGVWWKVTDELGNEGWVVSTNSSWLISAQGATMSRSTSGCRAAIANNV